MTNKKRKPPSDKQDDFISKAEEKFFKVNKKLNDIALRPLRRKKQEGPVRYASFNDRVFAKVIDLAISFVLLAPFMQIMSKMIYGNNRNPLLNLPQGTPPEVQIEYILQSNYLNQLMADYIAHYIIFGIIILWFWNRAACTPGKWMLKMRIVDDQTYCKPSPNQLVKRYFGYLVSAIPLTAGFAWVMVDKKQRAWHDMMAHTVVVKVNHWKFKDDGLTPHINLPKTNKQEDVEPDSANQA